MSVSSILSCETLLGVAVFLHSVAPILSSAFSKFLSFFLSKHLEQAATIQLSLRKFFNSYLFIIPWDYSLFFLAGSLRSNGGGGGGGGPRSSQTLQSRGGTQGGKVGDKAYKVGDK